MGILCALGWHRWNRGKCEACGRIRECAFDRHYWKKGRCEVCGSRDMGPAQIATLIDKIVRKRFDSLHPQWIVELGEVGAIAIPQIVREMKGIGGSEKDRLSPPFLDLRRVLQSMGSDAKPLLMNAVGRGDNPDEDGAADVPPWLKTLAEEIAASWTRPKE